MAIDFEVKPNLLRGLPEPTDAFAGGAHGRIAKSIFRLTESEDGGSIALLGRWGSGKSTIIEILIELFRASKNTQFVVFLFDVWAHQADPMRRAFLEELVARLPNDIASEEKFHDELAVMKGEIVETEREGGVHLTKWGRLFGLLLPLYPLAYILLSSESWSKPPLFDIFGFSITVPLIGLVILLIPYAVGFVVWACRRPHWKLLKKEFWTDNRGGESIISLMLNKADIRVERNITRSKEPTTIEYNEYFDKIIQEVTVAGKRLLVVIDNLDRLPTQHALEAWATLRNFFARSSRPDETQGSGGVWSIVPLSDESMEKMFSTEAGFQFRRDALGKTFDVTYRVPPQLLSDLKSFFRACVTEALGTELGEDVLHDVYRIFELYYEVETPDERPTPRQVKVFSNRLAIAAEQWAADIDIRIIAIFVLRRSQIPSNPTTLAASDEIIDERTRRILAHLEWRSGLAALKYGVPPEYVKQIVFRPRLHKALESGDLQNITDLLGIDGGDLLLESIVDVQGARWAQKEPHIWAGVCGSLHALTESGVDVRPPVWQSMLAQSSRIGVWTEFAEGTVQGLVAALLHAQRAQVTPIGRNLITSLNNVHMNEEIGSEYRFHGSEVVWAKAVEGILSVVKQRAGDQGAKAVNDTIQIPGPVPSSVRIIARLDAGAIADCSSLGIAVNDRQMAESISGYISKGKFDDDHLATVKVLRRRRIVEDWSGLRSKIEERLGADVALVDSEVVALLNAYGVTSESRNAFKDLVADGTMAGLFDDGVDEFSPLSIVLFAAIFSNVSGTDIPGATAAQIEAYSLLLNRVDSSLSKTTLLAVSENVFFFIGFEQLIERSRSDDDTSDAAGVIVRVVVAEGILDRLRCSWVLLHFEAIREVLGDDLSDEFLVKLDGWLKYAKEALANTSEFAYDVEFLNAALALDTAIAKLVKADAITKLQGTNKEGWALELAAPSVKMQVLASLDKQSAAPKLGPSLSEAMLDHARRLIGEGGSVKHDTDFRLLIRVLNAHSRRAFVRALVGQIRSQSPPSTIRCWFLHQYGPSFLDDEAAIKDLETIVLTELITPSANLASDEVLKLLSQHADSIKSIVRESSSDARNYFLESLDSIAGNNREWAGFRNEMTT